MGKVFNTALATTTSNEYLTTVNVIEEVTAQIEQFLDRKLIVREHKQAILCIDGLYGWIQNYPLISSADAGILDDRKVSTSSTRIIQYIGGYKRKNQDDLPNVFSTYDIETLPSDIRNVALELVLHYLLRREKGLLGLSETETKAGTYESLTSQEDRSFVERALSKIHHHAWLFA